MADEHGILLILDEVQTGFGRTGDWFAADVLGVRPDILVLGKAIANGFPLSAVGASTEVYDRWPPGSHGTTFGGNPVSCAAAEATIAGLRDVVPQVGGLSTQAFERFHAMAKVHPTIRDVRGLGLMIGVELALEDGTPNPEALVFIRDHAQRKGMFILACGPDANVIRFIPPLVVTPEELDLGLDILDEALTAYEESHG